MFHKGDLPQFNPLPEPATSPATHPVSAQEARLVSPLDPGSLPRLLIIFDEKRASNEDALFSPKDLGQEMGLEELQTLVLVGPEGAADLSPEVLHGRAASVFELFEALHKRGWDTRDIFLFGFGQHGTVALDVALRSPRPLGGVIASGSAVHLPQEWRKAVTAGSFATPRLIMHGYFDEVVRVETVRTAVTELQSIGLPVVFKELNKGHEFDAESELPILTHWLQARRPRANNSLRSL